MTTAQVEPRLTSVMLATVDSDLGVWCWPSSDAQARAALKVLAKEHDTTIYARHPVTDKIIMTVKPE